MRMNGPELVALTPRLPTRDEWQRAINEADFWVPFFFSELQHGSVQGQWSGTLAGKSVQFPLSTTCIRPPVGRVDLQDYHFALSIPNDGELEQCVAGAIALSAALDLTAGKPFIPEGAVTYPSSEIRKFTDGLIAHAFGKKRQYMARYPSGGPNASTKVVAIVDSDQVS